MKKAGKNGPSPKIFRMINIFVLYAVLIVVSIWVIYPVLYILGSAFSPQNSLQGIGVNPFPQTPTLIQFKKLFSTTRYLTWYKNTLLVAAGSCVCTVMVTAAGAYIFSRYRFPLRRHLMISFLIFQIFPSFIGMVSIYIILMRIGGLDRLWGLVLVYVAGNIPYNMWLVKGYMDSVSKSYDDAARIDGASAFTTFYRIILPIVKPIIIFVGITSFSGPWMDFIFPRMILRSDDKITLAVGLYQLISGRAATNYTEFAAGALLVAVPFVILFLMGQNAMMTAFGTAGVKE